ncbi:hypothetical protein BH09GEM1_BH09GEM1_16410 [soil metagenome]
MFIELVDALRCPATHEESWLVASATRMEARHIVSGILGCPVCAAEYPVVDGVVEFRRERGPLQQSEPQPQLDAMRVAAMLDLSDATGFAVLLGQWGRVAIDLTGIVETPLILVDPPAGIVGSPGISVLRCDGEIPLAAGAARAIAIDAASPTRARSAVRVTRTGGRVLAPVTIDVPAGVRELARDAQLWVGEREPAASPIVTLHVRRGIA